MRGRLTVYLVLISLLYLMFTFEFRGFDVITFVLTVVVVLSISSTLKFIFYSLVYTSNSEVLTSKSIYHRKMMNLVSINKVDEFNQFARKKLDEEMDIDKQLIVSLDKSLSEVYEVLDYKSAKYVYKRYILQFKEAKYFETIADKKGYIYLLKAIKYYQKQKKYVEVYYYDVVSGNIFRTRKYNYLGLLSIYFTIFLALAFDFDFEAYFISYRVNLIIFAVYIILDLIFDSFSFQKSFDEEDKIYTNRVLLIDEFMKEDNKKRII